MTVLAEPELKKEPEKKQPEQKQPEKRQQRFFCENCEREVFLNASYCDKCGGEIEWPGKYASIFKEKPSKQDKQSSDQKKD